jgi:argonaute-like protein implicated in RNA metabolism and viral defense
LPRKEVLLALLGNGTIGIDVKGHTAGFTVVGNRGHVVRTRFSTSRQKEQLLEEQVRKLLTDILTVEISDATDPIRQIVIHRDGRCWPSETRGIRRCIDDLVRDGGLPDGVGFAILEIAKSATAPVRLFDVSDWKGSVAVRNPEVGRYWIANDTDGYLCATGEPFRRHGTVRPLHVKYVEGTIPFELCLEDVYYLTTLAWTRPEDCTRYPITIKLTDRRLAARGSSQIFLPNM